jgi:hypothetical protein
MTLEVVDCNATTTLLSGADVRLGQMNLGVTDASGRFSPVLDDFMTLPIFKVSKADYVADNFAFDKSVHVNTVQQVCLVNPATIPDGHNPNVPGESGGQEFDHGGCFIVTATTGSADSAEVVRLRALRDRVSVASGLGAGLIEAVYGEYERFSPAIAAELTRDDVARDAVLDAVVRPLLAWYTLAGELGFGQGARDFDAAVREVVESCPEQYGAVMVGLLESAGAGAWPPESTPSLLSDLAPRVADFPFASWAILDPLIRAWKTRVDGLDVVEQVGQWLATAPLQLLDPPTGTEALERELETLTGFLSFDPEQGRRLGERLSAAWLVASSSAESARWLEPAPKRS